MQLNGKQFSIVGSTGWIDFSARKHPFQLGKYNFWEQKNDQNTSQMYKPIENKYNYIKHTKWEV